MKATSAHRFLPGLLMAVAAVCMTGCATTRLESARHDYFRGNYLAAAAELDEQTYPQRDRVLFKMERGTIRQAAGDYDGSNRDFISAYDDIAAMTAIQVVQDTGSLVVNDTVQDYRGAPFERTMLHAFTAKNHLMLANFENAAVEARRIIESLKPEVRGDYPEDAYARYMAGFCLGLMGDWSNAALQYRLASELAPQLAIDERSGFIAPAGSQPAPPADMSRELIVFVLIGRSPSGQELLNQRRPYQPAGYADIIIDGARAGRSYQLADTVELAFTTKQKDAIKEAAKTVSRIAMKEVAAHQIDQQNEALGALFRIIMIGLLEQPDIRRWETLPRSLQVARVPIPENPREISVRFNTRSGSTLRTIPLPQPLPRRGNTHIAIVRDTQPVY
jgi:tetratricopeptide (TPR) repeat protein